MMEKAMFVLERDYMENFCTSLSILLQIQNWSKNKVLKKKKKLCLAAWRILVPQPGIKPGPWQWKRWVLIVELPGNPHIFFF